MAGKRGTERGGPYAAILAGCVIAGFAIGLFVSGPRGDEIAHYVWSGLLLGLGVGVAIIGGLRLQVDAEVRPVGMPYLIALYGVALIVILAVTTPWSETCTVFVPSDSFARCSTDVGPFFILFAAWLAMVGLTVVHRARGRRQQAGEEG